ncbi:CFEM domain-containing protein [Ceratobasidium theobromae]|uniref:CFEM domain-containing protein n=1 Tax=Ceratobasidium theobromae TaxID=1582974 RepID=A0A5N5QEM6_9AGAM|nr:CFEM domain-containing protein [Ceratobasidium theobromae]
MRFSFPLALSFILCVSVQGMKTTLDVDSKLARIAERAELGPLVTPSPTTTNLQMSAYPSGTEVTALPTPSDCPMVAGAPSGGGATCVQQCLADSASRVGCSGIGDLSCVCGR